MEVTVGHRVFPVALLLEDKEALVVGGGRIAARKAASLVHSGASVKLVAPDVSAVPDTLRDQLRVIHRPFQYSDCCDVNIAVAATNDPRVNRQVRDACNEYGTLCCIVDAGWSSGDFITPAVFRAHEATVAITTGGESCRRAKFLKESFQRNLAVFESVDIMVLCREPHNGTHSNQNLIGEFDRTADMICQISGVHEFMFLQIGSQLVFVGIANRDGITENMIRYVLGMRECADTGEQFRYGTDALQYLRRNYCDDGCHAYRLEAELEKALGRNWCGSTMRECLKQCLTDPVTRNADEGISESYERVIGNL
jgi:siroheme synthase-like protein